MRLNTLRLAIDKGKSIVLMLFSGKHGEQANYYGITAKEAREYAQLFLSAALELESQTQKEKE